MNFFTHLRWPKANFIGTNWNFCSHRSNYHAQLQRKIRSNPTLFMVAQQLWNIQECCNPRLFIFTDGGNWEWKKFRRHLHLHRLQWSWKIKSNFCFKRALGNCKQRRAKNIWFIKDLNCLNSLTSYAFKSCVKKKV